MCQFIEKAYYCLLFTCFDNNADVFREVGCKKANEVGHGICACTVVQIVCFMYLT